MAADREARDAPHCSPGSSTREPRKASSVAADGRWTHHWVPLPGFILGTAAAAAAKSKGNTTRTTDWEVSAPKDATMRIGIDPQDMVILQHYNSLLAEAVAGLSSDEWTRVAGGSGRAGAAVRSPEEALLDPAFLADGCVVEVDDPEVGTIRQVGSVYRLPHAQPPRPVPARARTTLRRGAGRGCQRRCLARREGPPTGCA